MLLLIAANIACAVATWLIMLAVGARIRRGLRFPVGGSLRWSVDVALGGWALSIVVLVAGLAGFVGWITMLTTLGCFAGIGRWRTRRPIFPLLAAAAGSLVFLPIALGPPFFYDALVYHLGLPWQAMLEGGWHAHPENLFSTFPPIAQLVSMPALTFGLYRAPAILHLLVWVTAATAVFAVARRFGAPRLLAGLATSAVPVIPAAAPVAGFPAAEAWFLTALIPAVVLAIAPRRPGTWLLAGLLVGAATSARLQGIPWSVFVLGIVAIRCRWRLRTIAATAGCWLAGASVWWCKNLVLLGDPTAPVFWQREGVETLWRDSQSLLKLGASAPEAAPILLRTLTPELGWLLPLLLAGVLAATSHRRRSVLAGVVIIGLLAWSATGALPRFLIPAIGFLLALAAAAGRERIRQIAAGAAIGWCLVIGTARGIAAVTELEALTTLTLDFTTAAAHLIRNSPAAAYAESDSLPEDCHVLFVAEPRVFLFPRTARAPSQHDVQPLRDLLESTMTFDQIFSTLQRGGFTHLLVNRHELHLLAGRYPVAPWRTGGGRRRWNQLLASLGPPLIDIAGVQIYALPP